MIDCLDRLRYFVEHRDSDEQKFLLEWRDAAEIIAEIDRLKSLVGAADVGPSFAEITKGLPRRSHEDASSDANKNA
jgi:hypothetical protein